MTGPAWLALIVALIAFWPATCELTRLGRRIRHATRTTDTRKEKP